MGTYYNFLGLGRRIIKYILYIVFHIGPRENAGEESHVQREFNPFSFTAKKELFKVEKN